MHWNTTMIHTAILFGIVIAALLWALTYPPLFVPASGASITLILGQFVVTHYQMQYRDQARAMFKIYIFPVAAVGMLAAWLIHLARHQQLISLVK